uniref:CAAX prenyl protease 2 n=1 Tax=Timema bartmani TaxID=61472 RepID=A0A7R9I4E6_9NEOP|nr:unnamed protein product [Timema bartmani]
MAFKIVSKITEPMYWVSNFQNLIWVRNHIVAPLSEEFTFRACMLPLLLQCFQPITAIFVCPLFFGIGFQLSYTTIFGAYSAFLFFKTGHFVAPLTAHAFCNHMGFPDFAEILTYKDPRRCFLIFLYVIGQNFSCQDAENITETKCRVAQVDPQQGVPPASWDWLRNATLDALIRAAATAAREGQGEMHGVEQ